MVQVGRRGSHKASSKKTKKKPSARVQKAKVKDTKREAAKLKSEGHLSRGKFEKAAVSCEESKSTGPAIVLAHGAGSSSSHAAIKAWRSRLVPIAGKVFTFDYPRPHQMAQLAAAHAAAVTDAYEAGYREIVLVGSGMGARVAVHLLGGTASDDGEAVVPLEPRVRACVKAQVALGYPLTQVGSAEVRDSPLRTLAADAPPLLFVSGTNPMKQLEVLEGVRGTCAVPTTLCVAEGADSTLHSKVDTEIRMTSLVATIGAFVAAHTTGVGRLVRKKKRAAEPTSTAASSKRRAPPSDPTDPTAAPVVPAPAERAAGALSELAAGEAASRSALEAASSAAPFQPAKEFSGLRDRFTFANPGPQGTGYYADREAEAVASDAGTAPPRVLYNGVQVIDVVPGRGAAATPGQYISVKYVGTLESGVRFDSGTMHFKLGVSKVIKGWDTGVAGMCVGGRRKLVCPPRTAYGKRGSMPAIPPNATLRFDVELLRIKA